MEDNKENIARIGLVSTMLFLILVTVLHFIEPEFDPSKHLISEYELGRYGWMMSIALVAKNYCNEDELSALNSVVSAYLEFAEMQARRRIPMYMSDWIETLDGFLKLSKYEILTMPVR